MRPFNNKNQDMTSNKIFNIGFSILAVCFFVVNPAYSNGGGDTTIVLSETIASEYPSPPSTDDLIEVQTEIEQINQNLARLTRARELVQNAMSVGNFLQRLDSLAWIEFPVAITDTISNVPIAIVFDHLRLYPDYAQLEVVVQMKLPQRTVSATTGQNTASDSPFDSEYVELYFGTPNLKFSHDGGIIGDALLGLYSDVPIGTGNPSKFAFILNQWHEHGSGAAMQDLGTYVKIDCDGFVEMGVEADVLFSRDWIVPVDQNLNPKNSGRVEGHIQTIVSDWQNLLVEISLPDFAPAEHPDFAFNLSSAVFDFSDYRNSPNVVFPQAYAEQNLMPGNPNLWRGVYIKNLEVALPRQIKKRGCEGNSNPTPSGGDGRGTGMLILDEQGDYAYGAPISIGNKGGSSMVVEPPDIHPPPVREQPNLRPETSPPSNNCRTTVGVEDLLIDGHGVSGLFYAENVLDIGEGSMSKWQYSISDLQLELLCSRVVGFGFGGEIGLPITEQGQTFSYNAFANIPDRTYSFQVITGQDYTFPAFKMAEIKILEGSYLKVTSTPTSFEPEAVLYGYAAVKAKNGDSPPQDSSKLTFEAAKLNFHGLQLKAKGTKLSMIPGGYLSLENDLKLLGYPLPIADPKLTAVPGGKMKLSFDVDLNLMNASDNGFAASTNVAIMGAFHEQQEYQEWKSAGMNVNSIYVKIRLPALHVTGYAHIFDDHPVFGNGFQGALEVKVGPKLDTQDPLVEIEMNAIFGNTDFKYWYVDGFLELDNLGIPLPPTPLEMNGFGGGAYYHMKMAGMDLIGGSDGSAGTTTSGVRYEPYEPTTLGLKASIAIRSTGGSDTFDGIVTLELRFSGTGLQEIMFYGKAEIVSPKIGAALGKFSSKLQERVEKLNLGKEEVQQQDEAELSNPQDAILASVFLRMNFELGFEFQGVFRANLSAAQGTITGVGGIDLLISKPQDRWHLYVGGYSDNSIVAGDGAPLPPISVSFDLGDGITASASAYFLMGNDIPGPPPLHPAAAAYFGINSSSTNNRGGLNGQAAMGAGFAFGAAIIAEIEGRTRSDGAYSKNHFRFALGAGFDVSLLHYAYNTYCSVSGQSPHGHKGWRATGRIWAFVDGYVRHRGFKKGLSLGILIDADLPKPTFLLVHVKFNILVTINVEIEIGDRCGPPYVN